jgi:23S rRNA (pseudouridine1915-N3)-methyltransferase
MRFHLCAVGRNMPAWIDEGFREYARRMPGGSRLELHAVAAAKAGASGAEGRAHEARRLRGAVPQRARRIALDGQGRQLTTHDWAEHAREWNRTGEQVAFLVGGAEGLDERVRAEADACWSLSRLTLPHGLVRIVLAEQLYRVLSIMHNQPYHR